MISFEQYVKIKDNYCIGYFGPELSYVLEIADAIPFIEKEVPGVKIFLSCRDEFCAKISDKSKVVPVSLLKSQRYEFAYVRDMKYDGKLTPAKVLLRECGASTHK